MLGAGLTLDAGFPRRVPLILDVALWPHGEVDAAGGSASFRLITLALGARPAFRLTRGLQLLLAGQLEVGWLQGQGRGFDTDLGSTRALLNLGADVALRLRLGRRWLVGAEAGIRGLLLRGAFHVDDPGSGQVQVHRPSPVSFRAGVSLGVEL